MISNRKFLTTCTDCGKQKEHNGYPDAGCSCGGFLKIIDRWGTCSCGEDVHFNHFTNTCDNCETDYNSSGQELAPRSQWGEETGESLSDIFSVDCSEPEECFEDA
jgi:hypothetical protein